MAHDISYTLAIELAALEGRTDIEVTANVRSLSIDMLKALADAGARFLLPEDAIPEKPEEEPKAKPKKQPQKIDHGKIMALHKAGWSVAKIADEMKCSEQAVRNHLQKEEANG